MKLQSIVEEIQTRIETIDGTGDFHTSMGANCVRGRKQWQEEDLPACSVFIGSRSKEAEQGERAKLNSTVTIEAHSVVGSNQPGDIAIQMLADIQRAVETDDTNMGGLLTGQLSFVSDQIEYPDGGGDLVSVQVEYDIPHVRRYGDPDN